MLYFSLLIISAILQFGATFFAFKLIKRSRRPLAWGLLSAALLVMAFRRLVLVSYYGIYPGTLEFDDQISEWFGLVASIFLFLGMWKIPTLFADLQEANAKLADSEATYRTLIENLPVKIYLKDEDLIIRSCNSQFARQYGLLPDEVAGKKSADFLSERMSTESENKDREILAGSHSCEYLREDPERGIVELVCKVPLTNGPDGSKGLISVAWDITERTKTERALAESERRFRTMSENVPGIVYLLSGPPSIRPIYVNRRIVDISGYTANELLECSVDFTQLIHPEDIADFYAVTDAALEADRPFIVEYRVVAKDGSIHWVEDHGIGVREDGKLMYIQGYMRDITELKSLREEQSRVESELKESQRLRSLEVLAGGVAHGFNNLLTIIMANVGEARIRLGSDSGVDRNLDDAERAADSAAKLARQMLDFSGKSRFVLSRIDLSQSVRDLRDLLGLTVRSDAKLQFDLDESLPRIEGDATQIRQMILSLVTNAVEATKGESAQVLIRTFRGCSASDDWFSYPSPPQFDEGKTCVCLEISDAGEGIPSENIRKVFEPFYTTRSAGRGLGLSVVMGIVRAHNGTIQVRSQVGVGTTFRVLFAGDHLEATTLPGKPGEETHAPPENRTVLVVDDEGPIRTVAGEILKREGFHVLSAADGKEGLRVYEDNRDQIDLLILDYMMPGMNGTEVLQKIRELGMDVPVLFISGFADEFANHPMARDERILFLPKPFRRAAFLSHVHQALAIKSN